MSGKVSRIHIVVGHENPYELTGAAHGASVPFAVIGIGPMHWLRGPVCRQQNVGGAQHDT